MQSFQTTTPKFARSAIFAVGLVVGVSCASGDSLGVGVQQKKFDGDAVKVELGFAETINIRVPEYRILTGEYRLGPDGSIALPGVGRINVSKFTTADFEKRLRNLIYRVSNREANVAVEVASYRPLYVLGAVARAGSFPWRPGMSVVHAQALAGGIYRGPQAVGGNRVVNLTTPANRGANQSRLSYDLAAALATIERLRAERNGVSVYIAPEKLSKLVSSSEVGRLASRQQTLLTSRKAAYDARVQALQNAKALAATEKNSLEMQRVRIKEQLASRKLLHKRVERLAQQGYTRADRLFEEQARVAQLEERLTTSTVGISRMAMAEAAAQQELVAYIRGRAAEIDVELLNLEQQVGQLEIQLRDGRRAPDPASGTQDNAVAAVETDDNKATYEIIRERDGKKVVLPADRTTALLPGDVLSVQ